MLRPVQLVAHKMHKYLVVFVLENGLKIGFMIDELTCHYQQEYFTSDNPERKATRFDMCQHFPFQQS
jgi:hypothetical protein